MTLSDFHEVQCAQSNRVGCPESPSVLSVQAHAIPTVSALGYPGNEAAASPKKQNKKHKKSYQNKDGHSTDRLMQDFFTVAHVDPNFEQLEKKQLQEALKALSERLLLF